MAAPGPLCGTTAESIDAGTLCRHRAVTPGPTTGATSVTEKQRLLDEKELARLREIRKLVHDNNKSTLDDNVIICQIYMESRFDARAGATHDAKGLMQMQLNAVRQAYKYRKQGELGHMPNEKETTAAFAEAKTLHDSPSIMDEATNIQIGTEYMQYWLDNTSSVEDAYKRYRGKQNGIYYSKIKSAADKLAANPESIQVLRDMVK